MRVFLASKMSKWSYINGYKLLILQSEMLRMELNVMGRTKRGNANAQRNNNAKKGNRISEELVEFASYTEVEAEKQNVQKKKKK